MSTAAHLGARQVEAINALRAGVCSAALDTMHGTRLTGVVLLDIVTPASQILQALVIDLDLLEADVTD
jgi:hypothetical protein